MSGINPIAEELRDSPEYTPTVDVDDGETGESHVRITPDLRDRILAALKDRDVVLEEAAERAAFVAGYRAAHMVPDAYDSTSAAEEAWEGYRLVSRNLKERV